MATRWFEPWMATRSQGPRMTTSLPLPWMVTRPRLHVTVRFSPSPRMTGDVPALTCSLVWTVVDSTLTVWAAAAEAARAKRDRAILMRPPPPSTLPSRGLSLVLFVEPFLERREVVEHRGRVHLPLAGHGLHRVRPATADAHLERPLQPLARRLVAVHRAAVQRTRLARGLAQAAVELE